MSHRDCALSDSDTLITEDEYWFAVDASNDDIRCNAAELATAYANFYHTAKVRSITPLGASSEMVSSQSRAWLLHPLQRDTPLYHLLSSAPGSILESVGPALYLNIILWRYRWYYNASTSTPNEIDVFKGIMHKARLSKSVVALVWNLVTDPDSYHLHHPPSAWLLTRLLRVETRLSTRLQQTLKTTLVQFLLTDEFETLESTWLTPDQFQSALMADLNFES